MWIARDKDGTICIYDTEPVKDEHVWVIPNSTGGYSIIDSEMDGLADIKWEDSEPIKLITLPAMESIIDKLSDILSNYLHGGEIDEVIAEFETYLNKR